MWTVTSATVSHIAQIFAPEKRKELGGVVGGYEATRQAIELTTSRALVILALIWLSLGVDQPVPVPAARRRAHLLGAGREGPRPGDPVRVMERAGFVGFALVIALFVVGFTNDIDRLAERRLRTPVASPHGSERRAVGAATIAEAFRLTGRGPPGPRSPSARKDDEVALHVGAAARHASTRWPAACAALGVTRGDTVALMIANRPEFHVADLAAMTLGATPFSIYLTSAPDQVAYVDRGRRARSVAIVERAVRAARSPASSSTCSTPTSSARCGPGLRRRAALARGRSPTTSSR